MVGNLFKFARNTDEFNDRPLDWEDFRNAYVNLDVVANEISIENDDLEAFTKRRVAKA